MQDQDSRTLQKLSMALELGRLPAGPCGSFSGSDSLLAPHCHRVVPGQIPGHLSSVPFKWVRGTGKVAHHTSTFPLPLLCSKLSQFYFSSHISLSLPVGSKGEQKFAGYQAVLLASFNHIFGLWTQE